MRRTIVRKHKRKGRRVRGHYRALPQLIREPVKPEELSRTEMEELKQTLFPRREVTRRKGLYTPTIKKEITEEQEAVLDQYQTALWAKDKEAIKTLEPQVKEIKKTYGSAWFTQRIMKGQQFRFARMKQKGL